MREILRCAQDDREEGRRDDREEERRHDRWKSEGMTGGGRRRETLRDFPRLDAGIYPIALRAAGELLSNLSDTRVGQPSTKEAY